jgi:hypothetical protein
MSVCSAPGECCREDDSVIRQVLLAAGRNVRTPESPGYLACVPDALLTVSIVLGLVVALLVGTRRPSAVELVMDGDVLRIRIKGKDAIYSLRRSLVLPVASIKGIAVAPSHLVPRTGLRLPGTSVPGVIRAGSYGTGPTRDFWLVRRAEQLLVLELEPGAPYRRVVLEVPDPHGEVLRLRPVLGAYTGTFA